MQRQRNIPRKVAAFAGAGLLAVSLAVSAAPAFGDEPSLLDIVEAAHPEIVGSVADVRLADGALTDDFGRLDVTVHDTASIELVKDDGNALLVGLPFADTAAPGQDAGEGAVSFDNRNGSSTVAVVTDDGSVVVHTVIESADAPTEYTYELDIPEGAAIEHAESGEVLILDAESGSLFFVAAPWATDAAGVDVATRYEIRGDTLVQVVEHEGATYPVVADPSIGGFYMASYSWTVPYSQLKLWPTFAGGTFNPALVYTFGWPEVEGAVGNQNASMEQQFLCHCYGNLLLYAAGWTWDLENWRGTVSDPIAMLNWPYPCNW